MFEQQNQIETHYSLHNTLKVPQLNYEEGNYFPSRQQQGYYVYYKYSLKISLNMYVVYQEPRLVQGIQHQSHNEEGCEGCHGWDHLNNQEEDQTLFTRQEIVTAVCVTCEGNDTCLYNHGDNGDNQGVHIPSAIRSFREKF